MEKIFLYTFENGAKNLTHPKDFTLLTTSLADCKVFTTTSSTGDINKQHFPFLDRHLKRLLNSAKELEIYDSKKLEHQRSSLETAIKEAVSQYLEDSKPEQSIERLMLRLVLNQEGLELYLKESPKPWLPNKAAKLTHFIKEREIPNHKTSLLETSKAAYQYAISNDFDDAILIDEKGFVKETAWANLYWTDEAGELFSVFTKTLPGVMQSVIKEQIKIKDKKISFPDFLQQATSVFISNSSIGIQSVSLIDEKAFSINQELLKKLQKTLNK